MRACRVTVGWFAIVAMVVGLASGLAHGQSGTVAIRSHESARGAYVNHANALSVSVSESGPVPVVVSPQQGRVAVDAHQAGTWNIAHITSVTHVAGVISAGTAATNMVCHSTAAVANSASAIVIHATAANPQILICSIILVSSTAQSVSIVDGTGTTCGTGTAALVGSTVAVGGMALAANGGLSSISPFPWLTSSRNVDLDVCVLVSGTGRVSGVITYRGVP